MSHDARSSMWSVNFPTPDSFLDDWTDAKALVWILLGIDGAALVPSRDNIEPHSPSGRSWWQAAVDLLALGEGWADIAGELRQWRLRGYPPQGPVLSFVKSTWGDTIVALELYLSTYAWANSNIANYVFAAREGAAPRPTEPTEIGARELQELFELTQHAKVRHPAGFLTSVLIDDSITESYDWNESPGGSDNAHLSPHFTHEWMNVSLRIEDGDTARVNNSYAVLELAHYEAWYHKIHDLRRASLTGEITSQEISTVDVRVKGIGSIGVFEFNPSINAFVITGAHIFGTARNSSGPLLDSPRFGFSLNGDMVEQLTKFIYQFDFLHDEPIEELTIETRDEVGLAAFMNYCIAVRNDWQEGDDSDWSRLNGQWVKGWMKPDGPQYLNCLAAMAAGGFLEPDVGPLEQMIDDSESLDIEPWAVDYVLRLWDELTSFPVLIAKVASQTMGSTVSLREFEKPIASAFVELIQGAMKSIVSSDEKAVYEKLYEFLNGAPLTAEKLLEELIEAFCS
jgi:hypothetical protein